ncbi:MAG: tRNA lysidine(34) synthetase TilS [Holosporaceae bacterium]|jgi:tRNA(Ile)-lysidine synthase|nr:tRNA lysidine(34) synthetase TilS [Holosporaceae bacterium]
MNAKNHGISTKNVVIAFDFVDAADSIDFFFNEINELITAPVNNDDSANILPSSGAGGCAKICCAVSGGPDSMALLTLAIGWAWPKRIQIICVTVDHKLRPESTAEAHFVKDFCRQHNIPHEILTWQRDSGINIPRSKIEILARDARYNLICDFCHRENIGIVLTGHNWNDQLETFEIRQSRGSYNHGLAGMSRARSLDHDVKLLRPLLHFSKQHLADFLQHRNISWQQDPMNDCNEFMRSAIRKRILAYDQTQLLRASNRIVVLGKQRRSIEVCAVEFLRSGNVCWREKNGSTSLNLTAFMSENQQIQKEILKRIIWNIGQKKYQTHISEIMLQKILMGKINTIGRCLIKIKNNIVNIAVEHRKSYEHVSLSKNYDKELDECGLECRLLYVNQDRKIPMERVNRIHNRGGLLDVFVV